MWQLFDYQVSDLEGLLELERSMREDSELADERFIRWQYFDNPAGKAIVKIAKTEGGEVVGQYAAMPMTVKVFDQQIKAALILNVMTKKTYLRQGIFASLIEKTADQCQKEQYQFSYGCPNENSYPGFIKKSGFADLHHIPLLLFPSDLRAIVKRKTNGFLAFFAPNFLFSLDKKATDGNVAEITADDWSMLHAFWEEAKKRYPIMVVRDEAFLKWRYLAAPTREYKLFVYKKENVVLGYIVAAAKKVGGNSYGMILDFLVKGGETKAARQLLYKCFRFFKEKCVQLVTCLMLKHAFEYSILKKCGFFKMPSFLQKHPVALIYLAHHSEYDAGDIKDIQNWFFTMGDYDA
jgi:hypothetical protein